MRNYKVTTRARCAIDIICDEYRLQAQRLAGGHITEDQLRPCLYERLNMRARQEPELEELLRTPDIIPEADDDDKTTDWYADPRDPKDQDVRPGEDPHAGEASPALINWLRKAAA